jgi:thymidylate synthase (FAD)
MMQFLLPHVEVIGHTVFHGVPDGLLPMEEEVTRTDLATPRQAALLKIQAKGQDQGTDGDRLIECAGRSCYSPDTEVLTRDGWVRFDRLQRGVEVGTFDIGTGALEFLVPDEHIVKHHQGRMFHAFGRRVNLLITPDHNLLAKFKKTSDSRLVPAQEAFGKTFSIPKRAVYAGEAVVPIEMPEHHYVQATANQYGATGHSARTTPGLVVDVQQMPAFAEFLGWFLAEGSLSGGNGSGQRVSLYQKDENAGPIFACLEQLGWSWGKTIDARSGVANITVGISALARWLRQFGDGSFHKRVPGFVFHWPVVLRQRVIDAAFAGDGHDYGQGRRCYNTRSRQLAEDMQRLLVTTGKSASFGWTMTDGEKMYRVYEGIREFAEVKPRMQEWVEYDGMVYCVSTRNRTVMVRRAGIVMICGNCYDSYGVGRNSADYHKHIADVDHGSVTEHAWLSFFLSNLSRGLTHELVRHRVGVAISQRSTRYVDENESAWVLHPLIKAYIESGAGAALRAPNGEQVTFSMEQEVQNVITTSKRGYKDMVPKLQEFLVKKGIDKLTARKQARGAARGLLGNALLTEMVWSVNVRTLRGTILKQRANSAADAEIRALAVRLWEEALPYHPAYLSELKRRPCIDGLADELYLPSSPVEQLRLAREEIATLKERVKALESGGQKLIGDPGNSG